MSEFGAVIKQLRNEKGWSQGQLAVYSETSQPTVNQIETGKRNPSTETLAKLARALEVEVAELFPKEQAPLPDFENWQRYYEGRAWARVNLLEGAAALWQRFTDEGLYDLKRLGLDDLKAIDAVSLRIVLDHGKDARAMKRSSTEEQRERLEQAERRLVDTNLAFWRRVENELEGRKVADLGAFKARRDEWERASRSSRTA